MTNDLMAPDRLRQGYVIVLPGVEGRSFLNRSIVRGLVAAGVPCGIEIHDWTLGLWAYFRNLRDSRRHQQQAREIAAKIVAYRERHPDRPVYLIGHSGGGALTLFTLEQLPQSIAVTGGILLVPALSPAYDYSRALERTTRGLWNFSSRGDFLIVGLGTLLCGTCDGKHSLSAGMLGFSFRRPADRVPEAGRPVLHEVPYRLSMLRHGNLGGHFTLVNPAFVRHWVGPIVLGGEAPE